MTRILKNFSTNANKRLILDRWSFKDIAAAKRSPLFKNQNKDSNAIYKDLFTAYNIIILNFYKFRSI